ncbi:hypothetical protein JW978_04045 [Candidatus Dojkabacteria bacterium]|nr:hypothetical protein [Candidatus Dojkabacteria bacterium]
MHLVIYGRDAELGKIEFEKYCGSQSFAFSVAFEKGDYQVVEFGEDVDVKKLIKRLGGTVRIAEFFAASSEITEEQIEKLGFYFEKNFNYAISGVNCGEDELNQVRGILKKLQKKFKIRGVEKRPDDWIASPANFKSWNLSEGFELFLLKEDGNYYFAKTIACGDSEIFEELDNKRPKQEFTRGTSFRLARMMVNCLGLDGSKTLVDPFCGIGTFLIEGMFAGFDVIGIDNEQRMIDASLANTNWAKKSFNLQKNCKLICEDAQTATFQADACVFEPYMGPFMEKLPNYEKAKKISSELSLLYSAVFANLAENLTKGAPVVCIIPFFETYDGRTVEVETGFIKKYGFETTHSPIEYDTPDKARIKRRIYFLVLSDK